MNTTQSATVSKYSLQVRGRHVRWATRVTFSSGKAVSFVEMLPKRLAVPQALELLANGYEEK